MDNRRDGGHSISVRDAEALGDMDREVYPFGKSMVFIGNPMTSNRYGVPILGRSNCG